MESIDIKSLNLTIEESRDIISLSLKIEVLVRKNYCQL